MNVERVQNPAQQPAQLAEVGPNCCNSNTHHVQAQAGTLEEMRQLHRQLSARLPQLRGSEEATHPTSSTQSST